MNNSQGTTRKHSNITCNCAVCKRFDYAETAPMQRLTTLPYPDATILVPNLLATSKRQENCYWTYEDTPETTSTRSIVNEASVYSDKPDSGETIPLPLLSPACNTILEMKVRVDPVTGTRTAYFWPIRQ